MTTSAGAPVSDKTNSQTAGEKGPLLLQDFVFLDEMAHFDRERIPERVVHAKGAGWIESSQISELQVRGVLRIIQRLFYIFFNENIML